jgi:O-antigen/teichoic acid export membrane protein
MPQIINRIFVFILNNDFYRSSAIITAVNLFNAFLNYLLIIFISNLISDQFSNWTSLNGVITILTAPIIAANLEVSRQVAKLKASDKSLISIYYYFISTLNLSFYKVVFIFGFVTSFLIYLIFNDLYTSLLVFSTLIFLFSNFIGGNLVQFLIGDLNTWRAGLSSLTNGIIRFTSSLAIIYLGGGIAALPLGQLLGFASAFVLARYFLRSKFLNGINSKQPGLKTSNSLQKFSLKNYFKGLSQTILVLGLLYGILYSTPIISNLFPTQQEKDIFAVLFNFGQITFFGSTAFMSVFLAHSTQSRNKKVYIQSVFISSAINICIGFVFFLFSPVILSIFNRSSYLNQTGLIMYFLLAMCIYSILYISIQNLLAQNNFTKIKKIVMISICFLPALIAGPIFEPVIINHLFTFITFYIFVLGILAAYSIYSIFEIPNDIKKA